MLGNGPRREKGQRIEAPEAEEERGRQIPYRRQMGIARGTRWYRQGTKGTKSTVQCGVTGTFELLRKGVR